MAHGREDARPGNGYPVLSAQCSSFRFYHEILFVTKTHESAPRKDALILKINVLAPRLWGCLGRRKPLRGGIMRYLFSTIIFLAALSLHASADAPAPKSLFDGKTLEGWEGLPALWRVEDGNITGGSKTEDVKHNEFLATKAEYGNFILKLKFKLTGFGGFINSGIQIRSQRVPNSGEMAGYQCDLGDPTWWGCIYDESRRNKLMATSDMKAIEPVLRRNDWNDYEIRADGPRIITILNGVQCVDYTEADPDIVQTGRIGIQVHGGGKPWIQVKDITITELPPSKPQLKAAPAPEPPAAKKPSPLTGTEQVSTFTLPPGFTAELVAEEAPGYGKFIHTAWDSAGRLWTMTAMEYPVDANENRKSAEALYASVAKDKVLVYDLVERGSKGKPATYAKTPRVFAEGLAIPLGLIPYKDGVIVQHGAQIKFLRDTDGDGKADKTEILLEGIGIDDSHLFLHGFTRGPGGWIYTAQGAFNHSQIKAKDGSVTKWDFCKMGRFTPDGQKFELVAAGLNNIWGFVIDRQGQLFGQEANDMGFPLTEMEVGDNYPGIGNEKLKPYAPVRPAPVKDWQVGGTGLSGLALAEDFNGWPAPYGPGEDNANKRFYLANPITNRIQMTQAISDGKRYKFTKVQDFVRSSDPWFRPVHIQFGPDGCLYIVDWYNKIISHNEVPRNFPERDKTRGRIWRVRHQDQADVTVPDLSKATPAELTAQLSSPNKWNAKMAAELLEDKGLPVPEQKHFRWETKDLRAAFLKAAVPELLARVPAVDGSYEVDFERYLLRAALETKAEEVAAFLASPAAEKLPAEGLIFASVTLPETTAALRLAKVVATLGRPVREEELRPLITQAEVPEVAAVWPTLLAQPATLNLLLQMKTKVDASKLVPVLNRLAPEILAKDSALAMKLAAAFKLSAMEPMVAAQLEKAKEAEIPALLQALRELGSQRTDVYEKFAASGNPAVQNEALRGLAFAPSKLLALWGKLNAAQHKLALDELTGHKAGAEAVLAAVQAKQIPQDEIDGPLVEKLQAVLGEAHPQLQSLLSTMAGLFHPVLLLTGAEQDGVASDITLDGPFTVETWIKLDPGISNADGILGSPGKFDLNFYGEQVRLYLGSRINDAIVAKKKMTADMWQHIAITRDAEGKFRIYQNGELDNAESKTDNSKYEHLTVAQTSAAGGTKGAMTDFRVWNICRTPQEIRANFDRSLALGKAPGLVQSFSGSNWPKPLGKARVAKTTDFPTLMTPEQAQAMDAKFAKFTALGQAKGDAAKGKLMAAVCTGCHQINGQGGQIGPNLSGIGAMGLDAILRNILTPNAAMEAGYRVYQVVLNDGSVKEGFLAQQDDQAIILRFVGAEDQRIPKSTIRKAQYLKRSMMPEGLIDAFPPEMITDLLTYLQTLK
jgi:putative membrane-bound dehydrogenase-like protein